MKTLILSSVWAAGLFIYSLPLAAQRLNNKVKNQIEIISASFEAIEKERQVVLDQTAWLITQDYARDDRSEVLILDTGNSSLSQLAQVWLQASAYYFNLTSLKVASAGISPEPLEAEIFTVLGRQGFKKKGGDITGKARINYGSGSWELSSKSYSEIDNGDDHYILLLIDSHSQQAMKDSSQSDRRLPLSFDDLTSGAELNQANDLIALNMAYLAYRIKLNLLELKKI